MPCEDICDQLDVLGVEAVEKQRVIYVFTDMCEDLWDELNSQWWDSDATFEDIGRGTDVRISLLSELYDQRDDHIEEYEDIIEKYEQVDQECAKCRDNHKTDPDIPD